MLLNKKLQKGFTLIELLVVIAIIGVLSTLAIVALGNSRIKARDAKRLADIKQISTALELYYADNGNYPTIITPGNSLISPDGIKTYMGKIPSNPTPRTDGECPDVNYSYIGNSGSKYSILTCTGSSVSDLSPGGKIITSEGTRSLGYFGSLFSFHPFDEGSGTLANDYSNNSKNLTLSSGTSWNSLGKIGQALEFNNSYAESSTGITTTDKVSVALWIYPSSNDNRGILRIGPQASPQPFHWFLMRTTDLMWQFLDTSSGYRSITCVDPACIISANTWTHLAITHDYTNKTIKFYINGALKHTYVHTGISVEPVANKLLRVGSYDVGNYPFYGKIDDVRVYNYVLSDGNILDIYNSTR